jgi:hypothetical protein
MHAHFQLLIPQIDLDFVPIDISGDTVTPEQRVRASLGMHP